MTDTTATALLSDDDRRWLSRWRVGKQTGEEWLNSKPPTDQAHTILVKMLDRGGTNTVFARLLSEYLGVDPVKVYAENWPRKAARLAVACRERGDHPHADKLHAALVALMFCANCGRPLVDPLSIGRGIGPDCWEVIDPEWRGAISRRLAAQILGQTA
jgi:Family of unknown function (DUF6011)